MLCYYNYYLLFKENQLFITFLEIFVQNFLQHIADGWSLNPIDIEITISFLSNTFSVILTSFIDNIGFFKDWWIQAVFIKVANKCIKSQRKVGCAKIWHSFLGMIFKAHASWRASTTLKSYPGMSDFDL